MGIKTIFTRSTVSARSDTGTSIKRHLDQINIVVREEESNIPCFDRDKLGFNMKPGSLPNNPTTCKQVTQYEGNKAKTGKENQTVSSSLPILQIASTKQNNGILARRKNNTNAGTQRQTTKKVPEMPRCRQIKNEEKSFNKSNHVQMSESDYSTHSNDSTRTDDRIKITLFNASPMLKTASTIMTSILIFFIVLSTIHLYSFFNFRILSPSNLGDGKTSPESSYTFFKSIDRDGDGILKAQEVAFFLEDTIGGTSLDTSSEVNDEVNMVMNDLDRDKNEGLDKGDVFAHWTHIESLLTADEVKEWIENAVQLPKYIGDKFKDNGVTGYDFPELVENQGLSLQEDLGINQGIFRKKIIRHINARLLGVGTAPNPPNNIQHKLEYCSTVSFTWTKPDARIFPVHSYRVQRRDIELHSSSYDHSAILLDTTKNENFGYPVTQDISTHVSQWKSIYSGGECQFHDSSLRLGHSYIYRIQAWNSVGRSQWVEIDISRLLERKKCTKSPPPSKTTSRSMDMENSMISPASWMTPLGNIFSGSVLFADFVVTFFRVLFTLTALATAMMRIKRAAAPSSMLAAMNVLPMSWLVRLINGMTIKWLGASFFPNPTTLEPESNHDISVKAVGLNGYINTKSESALSEKDTPLERREKYRRASSERSLRAVIDLSIQRPKHYKKTVSEGSISDISGNELKQDTQNVQLCSPALEPFDDYKRCNTCHKRYKLAKRKRHHCARCLATFCHKHGRVTHSNLTSCKVPGTCICNICLQS